MSARRDASWHAAGMCEVGWQTRRCRGAKDPLQPARRRFHGPAPRPCSAQVLKTPAGSTGLCSGPPPSTLFMVQQGRGCVRLAAMGEAMDAS